MNKIRTILIIILVLISACKLYLITIGSLGTLSKSKLIELILPIVFVYFIKTNTKLSWYLFVLLLVVSILDIYFLSFKSSFFSVFLVTNPLLELVRCYGLNKMLFRILFHLPAIVFPLGLVLLFTRSARRYYKLVN